MTMCYPSVMYSTALNSYFAWSSFRLPVSLKARLLSAYNLQRVTSINWGIVHEEEAMSAYKALGAVVNKTGMLQFVTMYKC